MTAGVMEKLGWSRLQFAWAIAIVLIVHVAAILWFSSERPKLADRTSRERSSIRLLEEGSQSRQLFDLVSLQDPTTFLRLDPQPFVHANSLMLSRFTRQFTNSIAPDRWLTPPDDYWVADFARYIAAAVPRSSLASEKLPATLAPVPLSLPNLPRQAVLRIEGDLAGRTLLSPALPTNESSALLTNTVVRVAVDAEGATRLSMLLFGSGSTRADESAVMFASQARFSRIPGADRNPGERRFAALTWGHLVFQWFPVATKPTNQLTAKP
jgi:hypothetical protein